MQIKHITASIMISTTCRIDQTCRVILFGPFCNLTCLKLPPSLIKGHPSPNTRIRIEIINNFFPFLTISSLRFRRTCQFRSIKILLSLPLQGFITIRHILPNNYSHLITVCIPTCRLYLYMFSYHIKAQIFRFLDIITQCLIRRSCI